MTRRHSPSPTARFRRRAAQDEDWLSTKARDFGLPAAVPPATAVRAQVLASQQAFVATHDGSVASICGSSIVERHSDGSQVLRYGPNARALQCCALSPCGRYLAAGETGAGRSAQVLVFDRTRGSLPTSLRGHHRGIRLLAWSPRSQFIVSIGDAEFEQSDHQLVLWSWPQGERLTSTVCPRGVMDISFSPEGNFFAVLSTMTVKRWSISQPQDAFVALRSKGPPQLVGNPLPPHVLGPSRTSDRQAGRRSSEEGLVSTAWGQERTLFVLSRRGILTSIVGNETDSWVDINQRSCTLAWTPRLCETELPRGLLVCGLAGGSVQILDAGSLRTVTVLSSGQGGATDAVGVSVSMCRTSLWVLYADKSITRWRCLEQGPDCVLFPPVPGLKDVRVVPNAPTPQVLTCTDRAIQLWNSKQDGMNMESRTEPGTSRTGELSALACSSWAVASGHRGGEMHLHALPSLCALEDPPARHCGDVLALCFSGTSRLQDGAVLLASASRDKTAMVFRIDVTGRDSNGCVSATSMTLLLTLPYHSAVVNSIAVMASEDMHDAQIALCTADRQLLLRDLDLRDASAIVRRSHKRSSNARWIGLCVAPNRPVFFAACGDRRVLELDSEKGLQCLQAVRIGGPESELVAPLRVSCEGTLLAIGVSGSGTHNAIEPGVLLLDALNGLRPLRRCAGHSELACGFAFLSGEHLLGCWADGAMLVWDAVDEEAEAARRRRHCSPTTISSARGRAPTQSPPPDAGDPPLRTPMRGACSPPPGRVACRSPPPQRAVCRSPPPQRAVRRRSGCESAPPAMRGMLERLMASSPKPPKWAAMKDTSGMEEGDSINTSFSAGRHRPLGKWARNSKVGAQVRSAAELAVGMDKSFGPGGATAPSSARSRGGDGGQAGDASERTLRGNGASMRSVSESAAWRSCPDFTRELGGGQLHAEERPPLQPLPPKPLFPPPDWLDSPRKPSASGVLSKEVLMKPPQPRENSTSSSDRWKANADEDCRRGRRSRRSEVLIDAIRQEPDEVVREVADSLLASSRGSSDEKLAASLLASCRRQDPVADAENIPPSTASEKLASDARLRRKDSVALIHEDLKVLCDRVVHAPELGPNGTEAGAWLECGALLRRVDTLLRDERSRCEAVLATDCLR